MIRRQRAAKPRKRCGRLSIPSESQEGQAKKSAVSFQCGLPSCGCVLSRKVDWRHCHPCELGLEKYATLTAERLLSAIEPNDKEGEPPLLPILDRYKPIGSTSAVNFNTTRPCHATVKSH